ncbi:MAG: glycine/betaine ABC transporter permease [Acidimicrobiia bacterium]|nr:MAG: glycine/betaine ABC transporter permease [Acidimicrobiia bacterium]
MNGDRPVFDWGWVFRNLDVIGERILQHLAFTGLAVGIGLVVSSLLAAAAIRWRALYGPITGLGGVLYTIPSLAMFVLLQPLVGIGFTNGLIALVTYTVLILTKNIYTGITGVPDEVREAADGMGYRPVRRFWEVELPLALPVIVAGLRIATVTVVGLVTVTAVLGLGGLGFFILDGFRRSVWFPTEIVVGAALSAVLAGLLDLGLLALQRILSPWRGAS